jgi:hypothetical protein
MDKVLNRDLQRCVQRWDPRPRSALLLIGGDSYPKLTPVRTS